MGSSAIVAHATLLTSVNLSSRMVSGLKILDTVYLQVKDIALQSSDILCSALVTCRRAVSQYQGKVSDEDEIIIQCASLLSNWPMVIIEFSFARRSDEANDRVRYAVLEEMKLDLQSLQNEIDRTK